MNTGLDNREVRETDKGKATENDSFQRHSFVFYWMKMIFGLKKSITGIFTVFLYLCTISVLNTFWVNIVIVVLLLLGR